MNNVILATHLVKVLDQAGIDATFEDVVKRFSVVKPYYPLWVNVYVKEDNIVELHTCMRFRKPSLVFKNETGTEPFRLKEIL